MYERGVLTVNQRNRDISSLGRNVCFICATWRNTHSPLPFACEVLDGKRLACKRHRPTHTLQWQSRRVVYGGARTLGASLCPRATGDCDTFTHGTHSEWIVSLFPHTAPIYATLNEVIEPYIRAACNINHGHGLLEIRRLFVRFDMFASVLFGVSGLRENGGCTYFGRAKLHIFEFGRNSVFTIYGVIVVVAIAFVIVA